MEFKNILLNIEDGLAHLIINRPDKFNALSRETISEMIVALQSIGKNPDARVLIIGSEGKHFCTGHDLKEMVDQETNEYRNIFDQCSVMMNLLHEMPQTVIARVQGIATAAGCQLVAACDMAVAEENARFGTPGVKIGLFCTTPMVPLVRAIGRKRAFEMLMTGREISAHLAMDWGLINSIAPLSELNAAAESLARNIAQASPLTTAIGKQAFYSQIDMTESQAYGLAKNVITMNLTTLDAQEGIKAFLEKRTPKWQGK